MKSFLLPAATAAALLGGLMPVWAGAHSNDLVRPYFCGKTFTLFVMRSETVSKSATEGADHVLSTANGDYGFREADVALPVGARPVRDDEGVKVYRVERRGRLIGYTIAVDDRTLKVLVMGRSFTGKAKDFDLLSRFNFHPNRPVECKAANS